MEKQMNTTTQATEQNQKRQLMSYLRPALIIGGFAALMGITGMAYAGTLELPLPAATWLNMEALFVDLNGGASDAAGVWF